MKRFLIFLAACWFAFTADGQTFNQADTLTNLLARTPVKGGLYSVRGYYVAGDWGQPRIISHVPSSALTTNLGNVWAANGGGQFVADDRTNVVQDVRWWGAIGDGSTDTTARIQAAVAYGRDVVVPTGTFQVSSPIVVSTSGQRILGPGTLRETTILTNIVRITAGSVTIDGLRVTGIEGTNTFDANLGFYRVGIFGQNVANTVVKDCVISAKSTGIYIDQGGQFEISGNRLAGFFTASDSISGINNSAGIAYRDVNGVISQNLVSGFGQGICGLNLTSGVFPSVSVTGNRISDCGDNGVYLVVAGNSTVSGNVVDDVQGSGIKVHGSHNVIADNSIKDAGLGISMFGVHAVPSAGTLEYHLSTNKWGASTTNWFTAIGSVVKGNTIRGSGRHGVDFGYTTIAPNYYWNYGGQVSGNTIQEFGSSSNDVGLRGSGDQLLVAYNTITRSSGTNTQFGILFGGQATDVLGFRGLRVIGNDLELVETFDTGIQMTDVGDVVVENNVVRLPNAVAGLVLVGLRNPDTVNTIRNNNVGTSQIRFLTQTSTNVVLFDNVRSAVVQGVPVSGFFEVTTDTLQMTVDTIRSSSASTSASFPLNFTYSTNTLRSMLFWNKLDHADALASVQVAAGDSDSSSGAVIAYSGSSASQFSDMFGLAGNSDSDGVFLSASKATDTIYQTIGGQAISLANTNNYRFYKQIAPTASTNVITYVAGWASDPTSSPVNLNGITTANLANALGVVAAPATNGYLVKVGSTNVSRHIVGDSEIVVTTGDGQTNNTVLSIASSIARDAEVAAAYQPLSPYLTDLSGMTGLAGTMLYFDGTDLQPLGIGSAGQFLMSTNGPNRPVWATPPSAGGGATALMILDQLLNTATNIADIELTYAADNIITPVVSQVDSDSATLEFRVEDGSITTNKIDGTFHSLLVSGGGGTTVTVDSTANSTWNFSSSTPAQSTGHTLAQAQTSSTNVSFQVPPADVFSQSQIGFWFFDEFFADGNNGNTGWGVNTASSATTFATGSYENRPGVFLLRAASAANSSVSIYQSRSGIQFGSSMVTNEWCIYLTSLSSTDTNNYQALVGIADTRNFYANAQSDGAYFYYNTNESPNWKIATAANSVYTTADTGVTVTNDWTKLRIVVSNAVLARFFINNVETANSPITNNIPTGSIRTTGLMASIIKTNAAGNLSRDMMVDYAGVIQRFNTNR